MKARSIKQILTESRIGDFKNLLTGVFTDREILQLIDRDTSFNHKNLLWIGKILKDDPELDKDELFNNLNLFNKIGQGDLYSFHTYFDFLTFLKKKSKEVQSTKSAQLKGDTCFLDDSKRWQIVAPLSHSSSKHFGGGTSWCISTSRESHWDDYYYKNTIVIIKDRKRKQDDPLFKVALVGDVSGGNWNLYKKDRIDKIREMARHISCWNVNDKKLEYNASLEYLGQLPEDLLDTIANYFEDDDITDRQYSRYSEMAYEKFTEGNGRDLLLRELFDATVAYLDASDTTEIDRDEFDDIMAQMFKNEIENGDWDEFLAQLWSACISNQGVYDDDFYPNFPKSQLKNLISDTEYDSATYFEFAEKALLSNDIKVMDDIIKNSLRRTYDKLDPYDTLIRHSDQLEGTTYNDILYTSMEMYNAKYNPSFFRGQLSLKLGNEFGGIVNKFIPKNIEDVIKVLSINPRAKDMIDWIQKYRKDLYESTKSKFKYKDFFRF